MTLRTFFVGRAIVFYILLAIGLLIAGFYALNNYIYTEKQGDGSVEPYRAELSGEYVCLNEDEEECMKGLQIDDGSRYGIDFMLMSQTPPVLTIGDRISAKGVVVPIERLSADVWQQYNIEGIFSVTDSVEIL